MGDMTQFAFVTFTSILFLVDPIAVVPSYLAFTRKGRRETAPSHGAHGMCGGCYRAAHLRRGR